MLDKLARRAAVLSVSALALLTASAVPAMAGPIQDPVPIGHRQYFEGMVNTHSVHAVIQVACGGPATTGHPQRGQKVEVAMVVPPTAANQGYTGTAGRRIRAWLIWPTAVSAAPTRIAVFTSYYVPMPIPTNIKVPCSGTGKMLFVPAPGSRSARRAFVDITFKTKGV